MLYNTEILLFLNGLSPAILKAALYVSYSVYALGAISLFFAAKKRGLSAAAYSAFFLGVIYAAGEFLKAVFNIPRPAYPGLDILRPETGRSFPSGHASFAFGAAAFSEKRILYLWALAVAISRVIIAVHYPSDILAGAIMGYAIGRAALKYESSAIKNLLGGGHILEVRRKAAHALFGAGTALFVYFAPKPVSLIAIAASVSAALFLTMLIKKRKHPLFIEYILETFERKKDISDFPLKGAVFFMAGAFIPAALFGRNIASAAIIILALGDAFSTLIGKPFGKTKHLHNPKKSIEGSAAGFVAAVLAAAFFVSPKLALAGAFAGMAAESFEFKSGKIHLDDNLIVPFICGAAMSLVA